MAVGADYYRDLLRRKLAGRKVIIAYGQAAALGKDVECLRQLGAERPLALVEGLGTGTLDPDPGFDYHVLGAPRAGSLMASIRSFNAACAQPGPEIRAAIDAYDPDGEALVLRSLWGQLTRLAGREVWAPRKPEWIALEDKVVVDDLWDRAGVTRAPSRVVGAEPTELRRAAAELDRGLGTVWAGDAREGWHGGGEYSRWVRDPEQADSAIELLAQRCDRVRVMPFLEGIPCSIHGIVLPDMVVALRPVEMVTLRHPGSARFRYCGCSTSWDPHPADRMAMRETARRVGSLLRSEVGYRGTFTIDGVMTAEGFLPTELNPRFGAGMVVLGRGLPELPLYFLDLAISAGEPWDFRGPELERLIIDVADASRAAGGAAWDRAPREATEVVELAPADGIEVRRAADDEEPIGSVTLGPSPVGSFTRITYQPRRIEIGPSIGPRMLAALRFADRELGTSFGPLESAVAVR